MADYEKIHVPLLIVFDLNRRAYFEDDDRFRTLFGELQKGVDYIFKRLAAHKITGDTVRTAFVDYGQYVHFYPFQNANEMPEVYLRTPMRDYALDKSLAKAISLLKAELAYYKETNKKYKRPLILIFSANHYNGELIEVAAEFNDLR